jgi:hypothetical protein
MNVIGQFLADCCLIGKGFSVDNKSLRDAYIEWCNANGEKSVSQRTFSYRLTSQGFASSRGAKNGGTLWRGLRVQEEADQPKASEPSKDTEPVTCINTMNEISSQFMPGMALESLSNCQSAIDSPQPGVVARVPEVPERPVSPGPKPEVAEDDCDFSEF